MTDKPVRCPRCGVGLWGEDLLVTIVEGPKTCPICARERFDERNLGVEVGPELWPLDIVRFVEVEE